MPGPAYFIVPCFNEEKRLKIESFVEFLRHPTASARLLFVDDGSSDDTAAVLRTIVARSNGRAELLRMPSNRGKAEAVREGARYALERSARVVGYWDADLATPLDTIPQFLRFLDNHPEVDIVMGARVKLLGRTIVRSPLRHYVGRIFATLISLSLGIPSYDTQCGAKAIRVGSNTEQLFGRPFETTWLFDVELLARYLASGGKVTGIHEYPLRAWLDVKGSKVKPVDALRSLLQLARLYYRELRYLTPAAPENEEGPTFVEPPSR